MLTSELEYTYNGQGRVYPEIGTLKEIGAKVGDVVEACGQKYTVHLITDGIDHPKARLYDLGQVVALSHDGEDHQPVDSSFMHNWRIISRAKPTGPVRTVTRKEIVPGVYGDVEVYNYRDMTGVTMDCNLCRDELTAAIQTLTQIRDAMEDKQ